MAPGIPGGNPKEGVSSLVTTAREPRAYEIMAVFLPELADEELTAQLDRASGYITSVGGTIKEVLTDSPWGRRRLAYPIRFNSQDFRDGFYAVYHFDLEPSAMVDIERELKLDTRVMRYLVVHDDPKVGERNTGRPAEDVSAEEAAAVAAPAGDASPAATADAPSAAPEELALATPVADDAPAGIANGASEAAPAPVESTQAEPAEVVAADTSPEMVSDAPTEAASPQDVPLDTAAPSTELDSDTASEPVPADDAAPVTPVDNSGTDPEQEG